MSTQAGTGMSVLSETSAATRQALDQARAAIGANPSLALAFVGPDHDLAACLDTIRQRLAGCEVLGCTTAGELTERGLVHGGVAVFLLAADDTSVALASVEGLDAWRPALADRLCTDFDAARRTAKNQRRSYATTLLLTDGLCGAGEALVDTLRDRTDAFHQIAGGAAGDEGRFAATPVAWRERVATNAAAAAHVFSAKPWGVGVGHGLSPASQRMEVTRAEGNRVIEIDGAPAFEAYRKYAASKGHELDPEDAGAYLIGNELGVYVFGQLARARAPLSVDAEGALHCAAGIAEGSSVCILDGEPDKMLAAVRKAAAESLRALHGAEPAAVLLFDCVCRGMILGDRFQEEIDAVREVCGDVPVAGFLTYGEIARYQGKLDGWHNTTAVVVTIPA